ncbi:hypothetical protein RV12_GL002571 [Enterococcus quebecensis]|nr:hypothetical protein RV12_GL002571 [Enterococcus quebecensis]
MAVLLSKVLVKYRYRREKSGENGRTLPKMCDEKGKGA